MNHVICVLCLCVVISTGKSLEIQPQVQKVGNKQNASSPLEFPKKTDDSTPILIGEDPTSSKLPPKRFPSNPSDKGASGPVIISGSEFNITKINHKNEGTTINVTHEQIADKANMSENVTKSEKAKSEETPEQEDMLHSKYKGGQDVDELKPEKKATENEKKPMTPKKDPKSEVHVSPSFDENGPKLMNETRTKSGESMLESTSKMMAVSSSVLANSQAKKHGIIEPVKTVATVLLTGVAILCFGAIGFLLWKKISMRRFGRDVLINEDDFDEVADMHTFDRAQIQIT